MEPIVDKWDLRFLKLADHVAQWSKDPSTKVGAVIVDPERRVISVGYNGFPRRVEDTEERYATREIKYELIVHAEANAILTSPQSVKGCTLYTTPLFSCARCAGLVIQAGITRVVSITKEDGNIQWGSSLSLAGSMYREAGVSFVIYTPEVLSA